MIKFGIGDIAEVVESYGPDEWYMGCKGELINHITVGEVVAVCGGLYPHVKLKLISGHLVDSKTYNYDHVYVRINNSKNEILRLIEKCKKTKK